MLYFNDFIKILDIIQDYRNGLQEWQLEFPYYIDSLVSRGEATEEEVEYLKECDIKLEELRSKITARLAVYIDSPHEVLPYIESMYYSMV
jgi:hypothetical protein